MKCPKNWPYSAFPRPFYFAKTVSIISGKGGVGKTSISLKLSQILATEGHRILLIDCDTNLSNTAIKLGLPINQGFFDLATSKSKFDDVVYKKGHFHLLSACNGSLDLFKTQLDWQKLIVEIIDSKKKSYDFIFLDCPAGLNRSTLSLSSYCDHRFVIVTPDQSSMTDSYSLIKILNRQYKIKKNHLILNKVSRKDQYFKVTKTLSGLVKDFLSSKLSILGGIPFLAARLINSIENS